MARLAAQPRRLARAFCSYSLGLRRNHSQSRNPGMSRAQIEERLGEYLGIRRVIWLGRGIAGDDTHGHVDDLARFVSRDTVVACWEEDRSDVNYEPLRENAAILRSAGFGIVKLPMPRPVVFDGRRLPAGY